MSDVTPFVKKASVAARSFLNPPAKVAGRTEKRCVWKLTM